MFVDWISLWILTLLFFPGPPVLPTRSSPLTTTNKPVIWSRFSKKPTKKSIPSSANLQLLPVLVRLSTSPYSPFPINPLNISSQVAASHATAEVAAAVAAAVVAEADTAVVAVGMVAVVTVMEAVAAAMVVVRTVVVAVAVGMVVGAAPGSSRMDVKRVGLRTKI